MQVFIIAAVVLMFSLGALQPVLPHSQFPLLYASLTALQIPVTLILTLLARRWALQKLTASDKAQARLPLALRKLAFGLHMLLLLLFTASIYLFGWADLASYATRHVPVLADELLTLFPLLLSWLLLHHLWYDVDRAIRLRSQATQITARPIWSRRGYLLFHLQLGLLPALIPLALLMVIVDSRELLYGYLPPGNTGNIILGLAMTAGVGSVFLFTPVLIRWLWVCRPLPNAALQARLEALCQDARLRYRRILLWPTGNVVANAAVMGFWGPLRYLLVTDALLDEMPAEHITAVFAHEISHVTGHHLPYYGLFLIGVNLLIYDLIELACRFLPTLEQSAWSIALQMALLAGAFLGVFGWISRRFERDADVSAARRSGCPEGHCRPGCPAYDLRQAEEGQTPQGPPSDRLCPVSAGVFSDALSRIAALNAVPQRARSWRHSSISSRRGLLHILASQPGQLRRFGHNIRLIKLGIWLGVLLGLGGLVLLHFPWRTS